MLFIIYNLRQGGYASVFVCLAVIMIIQKVVTNFRRIFGEVECVSGNS